MRTIVDRIWDYGNPNSYVSKRRRARSVIVSSLIREAHRDTGRCHILDVGGEPAYWANFNREEFDRCNVSITMINTTPQQSSDRLISFEVGDGRRLKYKDNSFDLVHSNSVIEHVGKWSDMVEFAQETRRLAPRYYVQTPNFWFPIEPHFRSPFFHWLPEQIRAAALMKRKHGTWPKIEDYGRAISGVQSSCLLNRRQMEVLFPDAQHHSEKVMGLTKSLIATRTK